MSGVLRPVGPEPVKVYWLRRVIVLVAAVLGLVLVIAFVVNLNSAASANGPEAVPAPVASSTSAAPSVVTATRAAAPSATPTPNASTTKPTLAAAKPTTSATAKSSASTKPSGKTTAKSTPSAKASAAAVAACDPAQLRPTLTGKQNVKIKSKTNLDLSLINGGTATCQLRLTADNFSLTVYSGRDRIWSTADCPDLVKTTVVKIGSEDAYAWRLVWDGLRSKKTCKSRPEIPKAGTYVATAQFTGAEPVRFRMLLHK